MHNSHCLAATICTRGNLYEKTVGDRLITSIDSGGYRSGVLMPSSEGRIAFRTALAWTVALSISIGLGNPLSYAQKGPPPAPVKVAEVTKTKIAPQVLLIGTAEPTLTSVVASEVYGSVQEFRGGEGDFVKKGSVLARLDDTTLQIELKGAIASKAEAEALLRRARADLERSSELLASKTISGKRYTDDLAEAESIEARIRRFQSEIERKQDDIDNMTIRAPFSGFVVKEHTQIGQWVDQGGAIVTLSDLSSIDVRIDVPERYIPEIRLGADTMVQIDALNPETFRGKITAIVPVGDSAGRTFPVSVAVQNPDHRIKGGMLCRVDLPIGEPTSVLAVPKDAVVNMGQKHILYVVRDGVAQPLPVQLGSASDALIEVRGPVQPGMKVVVRGNERLRPGQSVKIIK
jgi:RND family efflux transporter MFP subunit